MLVSGAVATKPARMVAPDEPVVIEGPPPRYVSRGGDKLAGALARFALDTVGRRGLDAGSSTGGFTDALLQAGASSVVAVDVGTHQLHERLRADERVTVWEQTDIRTVASPEVAATIGAPFDIVVADLSFISLHKVIDDLVRLLGSDGDLVVLVKPQFEAGRAAVSKGRGIVRDPDVWSEVLLALEDPIGGAGAAIMDAMVSPLRGTDGNVEFLLHLRRVPTPSTRSWTEVVASLVAEADGSDR